MPLLFNCFERGLQDLGHGAVLTSKVKFSYGSTALLNLGLLIFGVSRSHERAIGLLWMSDGPIAETST